MNVYKRPLFRQMGGPAQPMPQDVLAAGAQEGEAAGQMLMQTEVGLQQETLSPGIEYAQNTMQGLDTAENFKQVIDSIRGNSMPIQNRYQELAQYVGPEDAQQTPESVLAMVQPTLMMTEEGAMNSGVGELMQGLASEVEMETATGEPTEMGQGLGSLMAAGQPVQEFNRGGAVQKFNVGGQALAAPTFQGLPNLDNQLQQAYTDRLGVYQQALGRDPQKEREQMKSNILFDIAQRGLAFASGVDPQTGENIAGRSMGAQLARQFQTLPGTMSERLMQQREREEGIKLAALQSAEKGEEARIAQMGKERLQGMQSATSFAMQIQDQNFKRAEGVSARDHETTLTNRRGEIQTALQNLQGAQALDQINARSQLQEQLAKLDSELQINRMGVQHENNLDMLGAKTASQITLMDNDYEKKAALQNTQLASQAEQNALDRALRTTMQDKDLGVRQAMQQAQFENSKELQDLEQKFKATESDKDRGLRMEIQTRTEKQAELDRDLRIAIQENDIEAQKALQTERLENAELLQDARFEFQKGENASDRELRSDIIDRQIQQQVFDRIQRDEQFTTTSELENYALSIKEQQAKYTQLGSSMDARMTSLLADTDLQQRYMNGTATPQERQMFEMAALSITAPKTEYDPVAREYRTKPGQKLTPDMSRALQTNPEVFSMIQQSYGISGQTPGTAGGADAETVTGSYEERYPVRSQLGLPEPPSWAQIPDLKPEGLAKDNLDYSKAFGVTATIDNIANTVTDFFGGELPAEETEDVRNYFGALNTKIIGLTDRMFEGRPSNFQIEITQQLLPDYGSILNGDEKAVRQLAKLKDYISQELTKKADSLDMGGLEKDDIQRIRRDYQDMSYLLAELEQVSRGMSAAVSPEQPPVSSFIQPIQ